MEFPSVGREETLISHVTGRACMRSLLPSLEQSGFRLLSKTFLAASANAAAELQNFFHVASSMALCSDSSVGLLSCSSWNKSSHDVMLLISRLSPLITSSRQRNVQRHSWHNHVSSPR